MGALWIKVHQHLIYHYWQSFGVLAKLADEAKSECKIELLARTPA